MMTLPSCQEIREQACFSLLFSVVILCSCELNMDALIYFRTRHGDTLLHAAVKSRRADALATFLELGCPTEAVDREGRTALSLATENGEVELIKILTKYGADLGIRYGQFNESLLHVAAKNGRDLCLFWLLDAGFSTEVRDGMDWTPLHTAAAFGQQTTVRLLVARGADVNAMESAGETPLHKAVRLGRANIVQQLLELGASADAKDLAGNTPIYWAQRLKFPRIEKMLMGQD